MPCVTSFFNRTLFRKNLQRFWPLWFGYTFIWMLLGPLPLMSELRYNNIVNKWSIQQDILEIGLYGGLVLAAIFGIFFAMAMFSYLTNTRATQGIHAMPVRRETLFVTNYLTGLFCLLSTLVVTAMIVGAITLALGVFDLRTLGLGLLSATLPIFFFYSFAVFCMMFTGQILAAPVFYGILNFIVVAMELVVRTFAGCFLFGYAEGTRLRLEMFSPFVYLIRQVGTMRVYNAPQSVAISASPVSPTVLQIDVNGLGLLALYAAIGVVFAVAAFFIYRKRPSEATTATVAIAWARPIFKYGVSFCAAFSLGQLIYYIILGYNLPSGQYSLAGTIVCMAVAGLLGYFAAEMLLRKSFRVWRSGRTGAAFVAVILVLFGFSMSLDLTGYESYIPDADEIASVDFGIYGSYSRYYSDVATNPQTIEMVRQTHRAIAADKARQLGYDRSTPLDPNHTSASINFRVVYTLKDGREVSRRYWDIVTYASEQNLPTSVAAAATSLINSPSAQFYYATGFSTERYTAYQLDNLQFTGGYAERAGANDVYTCYDLSANAARELFRAVLNDAERGIAKRSLFEEYDTKQSGDREHVGSIELWFNTPSDPSSVDGKSVATDTAAAVFTRPVTVSAPAKYNDSLYIPLRKGMTETIAAFDRLIASGEAQMQ